MDRADCIIALVVILVSSLAGAVAAAQWLWHTQIRPLCSDVMYWQKRALWYQEITEARCRWAKEEPPLTNRSCSIEWSI